MSAKDEIGISPRDLSMAMRLGVNGGGIAKRFSTMRRKDPSLEHHQVRDKQGKLIWISLPTAIRIAKECNCLHGKPVITLLQALVKKPE